MKRNHGERLLLPVLVVGALLASAREARAQCDPDVDWTLYRPTQEVAEVLVSGNHAWIGGVGGVIRVALDQVAGGDPEQFKFTDVNGLVSTEVTCLAEDTYGNIWVGTKEDGVSILDSNGTHVADLSSFRQLYSDKVIAIASQGSRVVVVSVESFAPSGTREGGGFVILTVEPDGAGGYTFTPRTGPEVDVAQDALFLDQRIWFATSGKGLYLWDETVAPADRFRQILTQADGLASANVKKVIEAPHFDQSGRSVLWLGSGAGLQTYDRSSGVLDNVPGFAGKSILDLFYRGNRMYVITESGLDRDLFSIDLSLPFLATRVPRISCTSDTLYVPRDVGVDSAGRIVLGTLSRGFAVREGLNWICPPPLGPHAPQVADLHFTDEGTLYFGTGDKSRLNQRWNGLGVFDGTSWSSVTRDDGISDPNVTEVHVWGDGSVWFGTTVSANTGGVDRWYPTTGAIDHYRNDANASRRTLGKNVRSIKEDADGNLWICYGQVPTAGLSLIQKGSEAIKNYDFSQIFTGTTLLRDFAFDSRGRIWIGTTEAADIPGQLYVIDPRGTLFDLTDDLTRSFNMANEIVELGEVVDMEIDSDDRIWIAGKKGLAIGEIDPAGGLFARWTRVTPTAAQAGGRNPLPYRVAELDWDQNLWLGTESSGLVRISRDLSTWTWFDQEAGCPLPDQSVAGLFMVDPAKTVWVGTSSGGIARIDLSGVGRRSGSAKSAEPFPNPWNPDMDPLLGFQGVPAEAAVDLRVYTTAGELVHESLDLRGAKTWNGTNVGDFLVESGVYVVRVVNRGSGEVYEAKVAVVR